MNADRWIDWEAVKVGDPDPTWDPDYQGEGDVCDEMDPGKGWVCTRDLDHDLTHVAGDGDEVLAVWS